MMKMQWVVIGLVGLGAGVVNAAQAQPQTCAQIRAEIQTQTGVPSKPNTDLLRKVAAHLECRFSSAEVYRAAYAEKPLPRQEPRGHRARHDDDDD